MSIKVKLLRSTTPGKVPTVTELSDGQLFLNVHDGKAFFKRTVGAVESIQEIGEGVTQLTDRKEVVNIVDATVTIDTTQGSVYRINVMDAPTCTLTFQSGTVGVAADITLYVVGDPAISLVGVTMSDRMAGTEKVDGGSSSLGVNFSVFRFLWTGYEWFAYKDLMG